MKIKISDELSLPLEAVTQKLGWLGVTGSGKTYGATKTAEQMLKAGAQIVVIDPVGVWFGLRLDANGKSPSKFNIPIFGGLHGDVPLESTSGKLVADLIVDKGISLIIDVSQFESDAQKARFARDFADRFFFRKKSAPSAIHIFIEECQEFIPQNPQRDENLMLHAFTRLQKLGRNFGIGTSLISQRPQEVNKKALNMAQTLFVFRTTGSQERKAIESWIKDNSLNETIAQDLPKLETGICHVWSPEFLKMSDKIWISTKETFNASATPQVGAQAKARNLAPIDLEKIKDDIQASVEKAKADDPIELRKKITELEKQIQTFIDKHLEPPSEKILAEQEYKYLNKFQKYTDKVGQLFTLFQKTFNSAKDFSEIINQLQIDMQQDVISSSKTGTNKDRAAFVDHGAYEPHPRLAYAKSDSIHTSNINLPVGEKTILTASIQFKNGVLRNQLTVITGYKRSSRDAYIARLISKGLIFQEGSIIKPTNDGINALPNVEPLPTGVELQKYWYDQLPEGERVILHLLIQHYPKSISRSVIDENTNYKRSSRDAYLARMIAKELVISSGGTVKASDNLF